MRKPEKKVMQQQKLQVEHREERGKGAARKMRAQNRVPAILYGGQAPVRTLSLEPSTLRRALLTPWRRNVLFTLEGLDEAELAMVQDVHVHPVTQNILHADFIRCDANQKVQVRVPIKTLGRAAGVQKGGKLKLPSRDVLVSCAANAIPVAIEIDVKHLDLHQSIKKADIRSPEGVDMLVPDSKALVLIGGEEKRRGEAAEEEESKAS